MKSTDPIAQKLFREAITAFLKSTGRRLGEVSDNPEKVEAVVVSLLSLAKEISENRGVGDVEYMLNALNLKTNLGVGAGEDAVLQERRLNVGQAAAELGCSVRTMYLWMRSRGLPYHRGFKKGNYFLLSELREWVARQEVEAG